MDPDRPSRTFEAHDQLAFARSSGDANPLHVDEVAARRLLFGSPVVHGIHGALWALDAAIGADPVELTDVDLGFRGPIRVGAACELVVDADPTESGTQLSVQCGGRLATRATVQWAPRTSLEEEPWTASSGEPGACRARSLDELVEDSGEVPLTWDAELAGQLFPRLVATVPARQLSVLLATTRIVGMECPGQHSLYSSLRLSFAPPSGAPAPTTLGWRVVQIDRRTSLVKLEFTAEGVTGEAVTFLRPSPSVQPAAAEVATHVVPGELDGMRLLIVGGSRGLGEVAAKLAGAAGADVRLTWYRGEADAAAVCADIVSAGGTASTLRYDVTDARAELPADGWAPTHVAWFATPHISLAETTNYSSELFHSYCRYFVDGFVHLIDRLAPSAERPLGVLYPSTSAIDEVMPKAMEYASAKAAGEAVCQHLDRRYPHLRVLVPRLPRLPTDQTASVVKAAAEDPVAVLLPLLRSLATP